MPLPGFMNPELVAAAPAVAAGAPTTEALVALGAPLAVASETMLAGFPFIPQSLENWCWAAVASAVDIVRGTAHRSQCQVAQTYAADMREPAVHAVLSAAPCCPPTPAVDTQAQIHLVLDRLGLNAQMPNLVRGPAGVVPQRAQEMRNLAGIKPVPIRVGWADGSGHFIAIVGARVEQGEPSFVIYDPSPALAADGNRTTVSLRSLPNYPMNGNGTWDWMYYVK